FLAYSLPQYSVAFCSSERLSATGGLVAPARLGAASSRVLGEPACEQAPASSPAAAMRSAPAAREMPRAARLLQLFDMVRPLARRHCPPDSRIVPSVSGPAVNKLLTSRRAG